MKIGYQGDIGSNSERATKIFIADTGIDYDLVPLIDSRTVVNSILSGDIDLGVMAISNSIGGIVSETEEAMRSDIQDIYKIRLKIHHCLFSLGDFNKIAGHEQVLLQTANYCKRNYPDKELVKVRDSAYQARIIGQNGTEDTAVICRKEIGLEYGLNLIDENIEDSESITTFKVFGLRQPRNYYRLFFATKAGKVI